MARLARSLEQLRAQVDALWPLRDTSSDGWIGDAAHAARKSDHNPDAAGVVTAIDITHDPGRGLDARKLAEALVAARDPRIEYIISNGEIVNSRVSPWVWRAYDGENDHRKHMHISVHDEPALYDDARPWAIGMLSSKPARRFENIWATVFAGDSVAYPDVAPGWNNRPGVALPAWFTGPRPQVRVINAANNLSVVCEIVDQGPWNYTSKMSGLPGDPYWLTGMRPQAESGIDMIGRATNGAGIDLTPAAARAIGFKIIERDGKIIAGGGLVHWEFVGEQIFIPPQDKGKPMAETPTPFNAQVDDCLRELNAAMRPVLEKYLKQVSLSPEQIRAELLRLLTGTPALPPPAKPEVEQLAPVPPVTPGAPALATPALQKPSVALSGIALAVTTLLQALGVVGTPFGIGTEPTQTGTIATLAPVLTGLVGATGGWGMALDIGLKLLGGLLSKAKTK